MKLAWRQIAVLFAKTQKWKSDISNNRSMIQPNDWHSWKRNGNTRWAKINYNVNLKKNSVCLGEYRHNIKNASSRTIFFSQQKWANVFIQKKNCLSGQKEYYKSNNIRWLSYLKQLRYLLPWQQVCFCRTASERALNIMSFHTRTSFFLKKTQINCRTDHFYHKRTIVTLYNWLLWTQELKN